MRIYNFEKILLKCLPQKVKDNMSDELYLRLRYKSRLGKSLNLKKPKTFNEKLQWLKLHDKNDFYTKMVDKYEVKKYVEDVLGERYVIPTLGVWNSYEEINFELLPNQFVLKLTHDSGGVVICKDKKLFDKKKAKEIINKSLNTNFFFHGREWPYKNVKPCIIAEQYMVDDGADLDDYKIFNFNGVPKVILVCRDRFKNTGLTEDFFSVQWEHLDMKRPSHPNAKEEILRPTEMDEMLKLAEKLSKDIPFVRTDFYTIKGRVYFGEVTFYPASGFEGFEPEEWDKILGDWLRIPC